MNAWSTAEWITKLPGGRRARQLPAAREPRQKALDDRARPRRNRKTRDEPDWQSATEGRPRQLSGRRVSAPGLPRRRDPGRRFGALAGAPLKGVVTARYLFGAPMEKRPVAWTYSRTPVFTRRRQRCATRIPASRFTFVGCCDERRRRSGTARRRRAATLDAQGTVALDLETPPSDGCPYQYTRRRRRRGRVAPAHRRPRQLRRSSGAVVRRAAAAVPVRRSERRAEHRRRRRGAGRHAGGRRARWTLIARRSAVAQRAPRRRKRLLHVGHGTQGSRGRPLHGDDRRRSGAARRFRSRRRIVYCCARRRGRAVSPGDRRGCPFYAIGAGYTAWERYDHNRIDLVPEQETYKPGDTARLMIKSPWEQATALLTVEREGIRSHIDVRAHVHAADRRPCRSRPVTSRICSSRCCWSKGGPTADTRPSDTSDPGKPSFRLGYARLNVEDASKRLSMTRQGQQGGVPAGRNRQGRRAGEGCAGRRRPRAR